MRGSLVVGREQLLQQIESLRSEGKSIRAIAAELGVNRGRIDRALRALARRQEQVRVSQADVTDPFIGRHREMAMLRSSLEQAISGRGQIAMLAGEPGIGKTRVAQELATVAESHDAEVFWGYCYEGEGAPPYWPWLQIIRSHINQLDAVSIEAVMGSAVEAIGEIVPELRSKLPDLGSPPTFDPDSARFRLFDSITTYLKNASADSSLVLILEDLHWADESSLALLEHIAGNITASNFLIVGTYRDNEMSPDHPLSKTLGSLVRHTGFQNLDLGGLSLDEVGELVTWTLGSDAPRDMSEQVYRRTEGNALFVGELLKLVESHSLTDDLEWRLAVPQGIRGVINRRFDGLTDQCNQALTIASVIGREFDFDLLARITDSSDDDLLDVVDEALNAHIIEESPGATERYRFTHALIEQTLYERQNASRRARLHSRIGETLEDVYAENVEAHASELVRHFSRSSRRQDSEKALRYGKSAAKQAASVYAHGEAAAYLEQCVEIQNILDPHDNATRCDLLIALGWALIPSGEPQRAYEDVAPEAFALAEALEDPDRAIFACRVALEAIDAYGVGTGVSTPTFRQWAERADSYAAPETIDRVRADASLSMVRMDEGQVEESWSLIQRALALARQLDDPEHILLCAGCGLLGRGAWLPQHQDELFRLAQEFSEPYDSGVNVRLQGVALWGSSVHLYSNGERERADAVWRHIEELADRTKDPFLRIFLLSQQITLKFKAGLLEEAVEDVDRLVAGAEKMGMPVFGLQFAAESGFQPLLYLGRIEEALATLPRAGRLAGIEEGPPGALHIICFAHMGRLAEAQEAFRHVMERLERRIAAKQAETYELRTLLAAAVLLEEREAASIIAEQLDGIPDRTSHWFGRSLGGAARLSGEPEKALAYYHKALDASIKMRVRPEIALRRLELAELLTESYPSQRDEAMEHLDISIAEFGAMKMQPSLDRALALKGKAESAPAPTPALPDGLTRREAQVLGLMATGGSNSEMAKKLDLSIRTVERHVTNIYRKIEAKGRADAIAYALGHDIHEST
jgi:DNA-binding CsgD family transcriptional regulator